MVAVSLHQPFYFAVNAASSSSVCPHLHQQREPHLVQPAPIEAFLPRSVSFLTQGRFKNNRDSALSLFFFLLLTLCNTLFLSLSVSLSLSPALPFSHSLTCPPPPPTPSPPLPSLFYLFLLYSFSRFAPVLFLASPRIPPHPLVSPLPSLPHLTLLLPLHVRHRSLLSASPLSSLFFPSCSPALCQRMSSTSINLSSSLC